MKHSSSVVVPKHWWPPDFGVPASHGKSETLRYASFPLLRRLVIDREGVQTTYDTGDYQFRGAIQANSDNANLTFSSQRGRVALELLPVIVPALHEGCSDQ